MSTPRTERLPCYRVVLGYDNFHPLTREFDAQIFHVRYWAADKNIRAYLMIATDCPNGQVVECSEDDPLVPCFSEN